MIYNFIVAEFKKKKKKIHRHFTELPVFVSARVITFRRRTCLNVNRISLQMFSNIPRGINLEKLNCAAELTELARKMGSPCSDRENSLLKLN